MFSFGSLATGQRATTDFATHPRLRLGERKRGRRSVDAVFTIMPCVSIQFFFPADFSLFFVLFFNGELITCSSNDRCLFFIRYLSLVPRKRLPPVSCTLRQIRAMRPYVFPCQMFHSHCNAAGHAYGHPSISQPSHFSRHPYNPSVRCCGLHGGTNIGTPPFFSQCLLSFSDIQLPASLATPTRIDRCRNLTPPLSSSLYTGRANPPLPIPVSRTLVTRQ